MTKVLTLTDDEIAVLKTFGHVNPCDCAPDPNQIVVRRTATPGKPIKHTQTVHVTLECPECHRDWDFLVPWPIMRPE